LRLRIFSFGRGYDDQHAKREYHERFHTSGQTNSDILPDLLFDRKTQCFLGKLQLAEPRACLYLVREIAAGAGYCPALVQLPGVAAGMALK